MCPKYSWEREQDWDPSSWQWPRARHNCHRHLAILFLFPGGHDLAGMWLHQRQAGTKKIIKKRWARTSEPTRSMRNWSVCCLPWERWPTWASHQEGMSSPPVPVYQFAVNLSGCPCQKKLINKLAFIADYKPNDTSANQFYLSTSEIWSRKNKFS